MRSQMSNIIQNTKATFLKKWKQLTLFGVGWLGLNAFHYLIQAIILLLSVTTFNDNKEVLRSFLETSLASMIFNGSAYVILSVVLLFVLQDDAIELMKTFKGWKPYVAALIGIATIFTFNIIYNTLLANLHLSISDNENESALNSIVQDFPFASLILFAVIGPVCEELTYRVGLFSFFKRINSVLAYAITIIIFALIHFGFGAENMVNEFLNLPFYIMAALTLTYLYDKYGFASSVTAHVLNNSISLILTIISVYAR